MKHLWHQVLCAQRGQSRELLSLPYSRPFTELSNTQLEALARHECALQSHLSSDKQPALVVNLDGRLPVTWVHIIQGRWILVAASDSSVSELSLWSLMCREAARAA